VDLEFLPQQLIDPVDGAAPREAAVEVCRPWAACLASFGRRKCKADSDGIASSIGVAGFRL